MRAHQPDIDALALKKLVNGQRKTPLDGLHDWARVVAEPLRCLLPLLDIFLTVQVRCSCAAAARRACSACVSMPCVSAAAAWSLHSRSVCTCSCSSICLSFKESQAREKRAKIKSGL